MGINVGWNSQVNVPSALAAQATPPSTNAGIREAAPVLKSAEMAWASARQARNMARGLSYSMGGMRNYRTASYMRPGMLSASAGTSSVLPRIIGGNFVFAAIASAISNVLDFANGGETPGQAVGKFVADTAAYTAIGSVATGIGALVGSMTLPIIGPILGIGIGFLLGKLYESKLRPAFTNSVQMKLQSTGIFGGGY